MVENIYNKYWHDKGVNSITGSLHGVRGQLAFFFDFSSWPFIFLFSLPATAPRFPKKKEKKRSQRLAPEWRNRQQVNRRSKYVSLLIIISFSFDRYFFFGDYCGSFSWPDSFFFSIQVGKCESHRTESANACVSATANRRRSRRPAGAQTPTLRRTINDNSTSMRLSHVAKSPERPVFRYFILGSVRIPIDLKNKKKHVSKTTATLKKKETKAATRNER